MARVLPKDIFDLQVVSKTLKIVWECTPKHTIIRTTLVMFNAILPLVPIYLFKLLLDAFADVKTVDFQHVFMIVLGLVIMSLVDILLKNIAAYNNSIQADLITDHMSRIMINKSLDIDIEYFDSDKYHDQAARAMSQGGTTPIAVLGAVTAFAQNAVMLIAIMIMLITLHWSIIFILFLISLPVAYIRFIFSEKTVELQKKQTQSGRMAGYYKSVLTGGGTAKEVRIFSYGQHILDKFLTLAFALRRERRELYLEQLKWVSFAQVSEIVAMFSALAFIVYKAISGNMTVGDISLYYMAFQRGQGNVSGLMSSAIGIHKKKLTLNFLFTFLEMKKKVLDPVDPVEMPESIYDMEVDNVNFIYPETNKVVLENISFKAKKGEIIAIVGENGSGKSTLIKLINRLYDPTGGAIKFNNVNSKHYSIESLRKKITVIFQGFSSYALSAKENITLSNIFKKEDPVKIKEAAILSKADEFIELLPQKYETRLGRAFKNGHELSKGQWQKLALARAFYKQGEIIVLDEPTSFIDPLAEFDIFQNFKKITKDKILFLITHRIYNLKMADKILVLDKGKLVEIGSHQELMIKDGIYKSMFEKQDHNENQLISNSK